MMKYFEHSCYPNVLGVVVNGQSAMITTRPIKKGAKVFKSSAPIDMEPKQARHEFVPKCECPRCQGVVASPEQRQQLSSDPVFVEFMEKQFNDEITARIEKCTILLQKYGHINFCEEIKTVLSAYHNCLYFSARQH